jgi:hypothetical protein
MHMTIKIKSQIFGILIVSALTVLMGLSNDHADPVYENTAIANSYPNDIGIERDTNVLYTEKFNDGLPNILKRYTDIKNVAGMTIDNKDVPAGAKSASAIILSNIGGENDGGHLFKQFKTGFNGTIFLRYYVKYPLSSKGYIHHESVWFGGYNPSTSYPNPRAGICGLGDQRISVAYEPIDESNMDTYLYWGDSKSTKGNRCYGNDMVNNSPTAQKITWDEWMCVEVMVKLNDPVSTSNGELKVWQNGMLVGHWGPGFPNGYWDVDSWHNKTASPAFEGFKWRTDPRLNVNYIWIEFYDDKSPAGARHHIKFANVVMAKKYIGPINK